MGSSAGFCRINPVAFAGKSTLTDNNDAIPDQIGPYRIEALIGRGGMGVVYRALDTRLDRQVALKVLPEEFARDEKRLSRFESEAKTVAQLDHPAIVTIYAIEEFDQHPPCEVRGRRWRGGSDAVVVGWVLSCLRGDRNV